MHQVSGLPDRVLLSALRLGRPGGRGGLGERRVLGVLLRGRGPVRHRARTCLARGPHLLQEHRRAERRGCVSPPVAGAGQPERGPGGGHVGQPALLAEVPRSAGGPEGRERRRAPGWAGPAGRRRRPATRTGSAARSRSSGSRTWAWPGTPAPSGPADSPGTTTAAHCRPFDACTVARVTVSPSPTRPDSRPNSSSSAAVR